MLGGIGAWEIALILFLLLLLFGAKRIPQIARGLGEGIRNFKTGIKEPERLEKGEGERSREEERKS
jgi:sec-independent protein translocase protein TatA